MFAGLSAFPLTPLSDDAVDEAAFSGLVERLAEAKVDSITALGSTGSYAYLSSEERSRVARLAVEHAGGTPVFIGIGALRTSQVLANAEKAEQAGASGLLLAPMTYQPLTDDDVFELFRTVTVNSSLPVIVYDNPGTTHFTFTTELYGRIAELPGIASIKIPGVPDDPEQAQARIQEIREAVPAHVSIGVSGDAKAAAGLAAGCDTWYSVIAGAPPRRPCGLPALPWKDGFPTRSRSPNGSHRCGSCSPSTAGASGLSQPSRNSWDSCRGRVCPCRSKG
ncbi:4-hydroxy-tetrahydrodipicolinate synthase [Arthrobacter crystallopoietes]|uniref:4-hydroxy-tetrahydrodipicolinate synthase n=1 Tax=Crystallibacter crystallopoietes TaxID=37928 RepID=A0A1H1DBY0_9MICC|nr:4-hydroxy-tetrahydrodipicolinate synthase [Arthrobacter crystallopoietes]